MARHLRAIFRFRTKDDDPKEVRWAISILRGTLRTLRTRDRHAELRVIPDAEPDAPAHDQDGD